MSVGLGYHPALSIDYGVSLLELNVTGFGDAFNPAAELVSFLSYDRITQVGVALVVVEEGRSEGEAGEGHVVSFALFDVSKIGQTFKPPNKYATFFLFYAKAAAQRSSVFEV
jgi:hypothetical protein